MPVYNYKCHSCSNLFDKVIEIKALGTTKVKCPKCKSKSVARRIITSPTIQFIGSGFYSNDSKKGK